MRRFTSFLAGRAKSFAPAGAGLLRLVREERNARIHLAAAIAVLGLASWLRIEMLEWAIVVLAIALVFAAEAANTAIERLADSVTRERHPLIGAAKDLGAACVLIAALGAITIGALVFGSRFFH